MQFNVAERLWCIKVMLQWASAAVVCAVGPSGFLLASIFPFGGRAWGPFYVGPAKAHGRGWRLREERVCGLVSWRQSLSRAWHGGTACLVGCGYKGRWRLWWPR